MNGNRRSIRPSLPSRAATLRRRGTTNHNDGNAVDLAYNGKSLAEAPKEVVDWVHQNASKYGLYFPMAWEPWHVEPQGSRSATVAPKANGIAPRSTMPSFDDIETKLQGITDPKVRDLTRKRIYAVMEAQNKAVEQQQKAAQAELWKFIDQGQTPDQVPMETRQAAGMSAVSSAWSYMETAAKGRAVESDEVLLYDMRKYAASKPADFAAIDLNSYRDRLSKEAIKELTGLQASALTDERKAREDGAPITAAFTQAESQLAAVGISTAGETGGKREEQAKRIAAFQNSLAMQMEEFKRQNSDRKPNQLEIQQMINHLLLPIVVKTPASFLGIGLPDSSKNGFLFEAGGRSDNSTVDVAVQYGDIPIDLRRGIALDLERDLGRKPSNEEVVARYEAFALSH
jgi:hypothetical protein